MSTFEMPVANSYRDKLMYNDMLLNSSKSWARKVLANPNHASAQDADRPAELLSKYSEQLKVIDMQMCKLSEIKRDTELKIANVKLSPKKMLECGRKDTEPCSCSSST